jgi:putative aldouronate transport system substrate-binding protein
MKKFFSLLLVLSLGVGLLTGCKSNSSDNTQGANDITATTGSEDSSQDNTSVEPVELDIFIDQSWWPTDKFEGIIPEAIQAATGVKLNVTVAADSNQLGLMIAQNELPDLVFTNMELNRLSNSNLCYSYDELLTKYMPDTTFNEGQVNVAKTLSSDGNYYCLLNMYNTKEQWAEAPVAPGQGCIYYRKDMYEAIGSPKMETMEDFLDVCGKIKEAYPDYTAFALGGDWKLDTISAWCGISADYQYTEDGSVAYKSSLPAYKSFLKYANTLARDGYITAEDYANTNENDGAVKPENNQAFAFSWYLKPSNHNELQTNTELVYPDAEWAVLEPLADEGTEVYSTGSGWCGTFISKNCSNPEAAIRLISYLFSEEGIHLSKWGREGTDYTLDANGVPTWSDEWIETAKDTTKMNEVFNQWFYLGCDSISDVMPDYAGMTQEEIAPYLSYKEIMKFASEIGIAVPSTTSDEGLIKTKLTEMLEAQEAKVIFSESDAEFEKNYKDLQDNAASIGVDKLNTYMTQNVADIKEQFGLK